MKKGLVLSFIFASLILFISYLPNLYEASQIEKLSHDRIMIWGEHIYTYDYNVYLSKIRQGDEGRLTIINKYDNQPQQKGIFLQMTYLLSGKIGGLFGIPPILTFHIIRTIFSFTWILTIVFLCLYFLKKPFLSFLAVVICLLASSLPVFYKIDGQFWIGNHMSWWQEMDVLKRISYIPHYTLNYIIIATLTFLLYKFSKTDNKKYFFLICIILFFSFFIHPSGGLVFLFSWVIYHIIKKNLSKQKIFYTIILFIIALIALFYIKSVGATGSWRGLVEFDHKYSLPFTLKEYILSLGPVFFSGVAGIFFVLIKKEERLYPIVTWILGAFAAILIFIIFPYQSPVRFIQTANHIPLAILSVYFVFELRRSTTKLGLIWLTLIIILGITQTIYSFKSQTHFIHQRAVATLPLVPYPSQVMYPLKDFYFGLMWLENNTNRNDVVLSEITAGNYIPAYSGNFVYFGHSGETPNFEDRAYSVKRFFSGSMTKTEAQNFLIKEKIVYVFLGPQEKEDLIAPVLALDFLIPVYTSYHVNIYKVKK